MLVTPRSLSALTRLEPMKPAAPVTTVYMVCLLPDQFFAGRHGRAELADDDAGRAVGDAHGVRQPGARGEHHARAWRSRCRRRRSRRTLRAPAPARAVRRPLRNSVMPSSLRVTSSASSPSSRAQRSALRGEVGLVLPAADDLAQFGAVGREQGRAAVARVVVALRDRPAPACRRARQTDHSRRCGRGRPCRSRRGSPRRRPASACSKSASLAASTSLEGGVSKSMRSSCCWRPITRSLTVVGIAASRVQAGANAGRVEQPRQAPAGLVVADHRQQRAPRRRAPRVARDVGGAAGTLLAALDLHHRHRRLRRDARDVAEPVAVEHHVADHQHARPRGVGNAQRRRACAPLMPPPSPRPPMGKYSMPCARTTAGS